MSAGPQAKRRKLSHFPKTAQRAAVRWAVLQAFRGFAGAHVKMRAYPPTHPDVPSPTKILLAVIVVAAYLVLMHHSASAPDAVARTFVLTVLAWQIFAVAILWQNGKRLLALLVAAPAPLLFVFYDQLKHLEWLCLVPNILVNASLMMFFGRTLFAPHTPLITQLALRVHGELPPPIRDYTRVLTIVWTLFFALSIAVSLGLYFFVSFAAWSLFSNVYSLPIMLSLFAVEYLYRRLRYPWFEHVSITAGVKAFAALSNTTKPGKPQ
jgi:uncharacterized membrane protein